tara:strand:- start:392 stop:1900 length:1509 start_codon:yes stop_codon:yes gene_type:complete
MAYVPKTARQILRDLVAGTVARSELTDVTEGSVLAQLLSTVASELSGSEYRMSQIRDSYDLSNVSGADLDERVAEFPLGAVSRLPASAAAGAAVNLIRVAPEGEVLPELVIPAGSLMGRSKEPSMVYALSDSVTFDEFGPFPQDKEQKIFNVSIVCMTQGTTGNCPPNSIDRNISLPSEVSVEQVALIAGGQGIEPDESLRNRAILYLSSLARCQPVALEYFALSFVASDNTRLRYASLNEFIDRRGYSELYIDDGSIIVQGREVGTRPGRTITGTVPGGGFFTIHHEGPSVYPIGADPDNDPSHGLFKNPDENGAGGELISPANFVSIPERGVVYVSATDVDGNPVFEAGDTYILKGYRVFTGRMIPELQRAIEGDTNDPVNFPGMRAAGTRVRVLPPQVEVISFDIMIIPKSGVSFVDTADAVREACVEFVLTLRPGDTLYVSQLTDRVMNNPDLIDVKFFVKDSNGQTRYPDKNPGGKQKVLRPDPDDISVIPPEDFDA